MTDSPRSQKPSTTPRGKPEGTTVPKIRTRPGDRLLIFDKRGTITHVQTLGKGVVKVSKAERAT